MRPDHVFSNCVRASISKSYEFCLDAHRKTTEKSAFFLVASLRSICEDLIVLSYISTLPKEERDQLTTLMMHRELAVQLDAQSKFFRTARPDQAVLGAGNSKASDFESQIREIWKKNGWPGLSSAWMPQIRQIADKNHYDLLVTLYDFLYRLTSGMVHFNPAVLIRSGWGDPPESHFSPRNFHKYYLACARIYGSLLLCCYFELFGRLLRPGKSVTKFVTELRESLLQESRWPEMITYEEMNLKPPKGAEIIRIAYRMIDADRRKKRFLERKPPKLS